MDSFVPSEVEGRFSNSVPAPVDFARNERAEEDALALYIHWPFCVSKCPYCDFNSHVRTSVDQALWQEALLADLAYEARSEEHTSELQSLMRISYAVFCLKKKKKHKA